MIALALFIAGCESKKSAQNKPAIPNALLNAPKIAVEKEPKTDKEIAIFMLDLFEAYEKCALNLRSIKKIIDAQERG